MSQSTKVALAFLVAPGVASLIFGLLMGGHPVWFLYSGVFAYLTALFIGVPAYLILRRVAAPTLGNTGLTGALVVAVPVLLLLLSMEPAWEESMFDIVTVTNKRRTLAGYGMLLVTSSFFGAFGALGGALFWLVARPSPRRE